LENHKKPPFVMERQSSKMGKRIQ